MAQYYYLISSLPPLEPNAEPAITPEEFMDQCADWLDKTGMRQLAGLELMPRHAEEGNNTRQGVAARWNDWDTCLRNALVRQRASSSGGDVETLLRPELDCYAEITSGVQEAWAQNNPLEREKVLYRLRWSFLEALEGCHHFDFSRLAVYKLKLLLCHRWMEVNAAAGKKNFDDTVTRIGELSA